MIFLREITQHDLLQINQWRQDRHLADQLGDTFRYVNLESDEQWYARYRANRSRQIRLAICLQKDQLHIGNTYLLDIDPINRSANFHLFIGEEKFRGMGYGKAATLACLYHGFYDHNLHRIALTVLANNQRAIALYERCGFVAEGTARQATFKNGQYLDTLHMAILQEEFRHE